jgi:hypothetical protein
VRRGATYVKAAECAKIVPRSKSIASDCNSDAWLALFDNHFDMNSIQMEARVYGAKCVETWPIEASEGTRK